MLTFLYRWNIPREEQENFRKDWTELTKVAKSDYGAINVVLYRSENGDFVALANWPSIEHWEIWKETLASHPMRVKYRDYRIAGPELLFPIVTHPEEVKK